MDKSLYEKVFGESATYNAVVSDNDIDEKAMAKNLTDSEEVLNVILTSDVIEKTNENMESFNGIIMLIVVVASLLVFAVLYNLTSINISERTREIATLKVLGFTDTETNSYIYREAFILSLVSICVGLVAGIYLHRLVITLVEGFTCS
jgi:putative ABC transport system permease protein